MTYSFRMRGMMMLGTLLIAGLVLPRSEAQTQRPLNLMPWPSSVQTGSGDLPINACSP